MKEKATKLALGSLFMGCVMVMGLFGTPAAHATESQPNDSNALNA